MGGLLSKTACPYSNAKTNYICMKSNITTEANPLGHLTGIRTLQPILHLDRMARTSPGPAPGYRRHACKAKSVPPDHNIESAYFDIPLNEEHGRPVFCCHSACSSRQRGLPRFQYCSVCQRVAASQHFWDRHSHEEIFKNATAATQLASAFSPGDPPIIDDSNKNPLSTNAESVSYLGCAVPIKFSSDPQEATLTMDLTQTEIQWLNLLRIRSSAPAITMDDRHHWKNKDRAVSPKDAMHQQWTEKEARDIIGVLTPSTKSNYSSKSSDTPTFSFQESESVISTEALKLLLRKDSFDDLSVDLSVDLSTTMADW